MVKKTRSLILSRQLTKGPRMSNKKSIIIVKNAFFHSEVEYRTTKEKVIFDFCRKEGGIITIGIDKENFIEFLSDIKKEWDLKI